MMENSNPFYDRMDALSDEELLKVLSLKDQYDPGAAKAAEAIYQKRNLSKEVVANINEDIRLENFEQEEKVRKRREKVNEALSIASVFSNGMTTEFDKNQLRGFKLLIIGLTIYYVYGLYGALPYIDIIFSIEDTGSFSLLIEMLVSLILFPIGIFLLARLKKDGWIILLFIFMSKLILMTGVVIFGIHYQIDSWLNPRTPSIFDGFEQQPNWIINLLTLLIQGAVVWYFLKDSVMRLVKVQPVKKRLYILTAIAVSVIYIYCGFLFNDRDIELNLPRLLTSTT